METAAEGAGCRSWKVSGYFPVYDLEYWFVSGFLVAGKSMVATYDESFDKYNIENGNFEYKDEASSEAVKAIEDEG